MAQTHEIALIKPKPTSEEIIRFTSEYFDAKGREYDQFEKATQKRDLFTGYGEAYGEIRESSAQGAIFVQAVKNKR